MSSMHMDRILESVEAAAGEIYSQGASSTALESAGPRALVATEEPFAVGTRVRIKDASYGWDRVEPGDCATIVSFIEVSPSIYVYRLAVDNKSASWNASVRDFDVIGPSEEGTPQSTEARNRLAEFDTLNFRHVYEGIKNTIDSNVQRIQELSREIALLMRENSKIQVFYNSRRSKLSSPAYKTSQYPTYCACLDVLYKGFFLKEKYLIGITRDVIIEHVYGKARRMVRANLGEFKIILDLADSTFMVHAEDDNLNPFGGEFEHPHVHFSKPCLGTYAVPLNNALAECNYFEAFHIMADFMTSWYPEGHYRSLLHWLPESEQSDWCLDCGEHVEECSCEEAARCEDCGEPESDCQCPHCPDSGDRLSYGVFPDDMCARCGHCLISGDRVVCTANDFPVESPYFENRTDECSERFMRTYEQHNPNAITETEESNAS